VEAVLGEPEGAGFGKDPIDRRKAVGEGGIETLGEACAATDAAADGRGSVPPTQPAPRARSPRLVWGAPNSGAPISRDRVRRGPCAPRHGPLPATCADATSEATRESAITSLPSGSVRIVVHAIAGHVGYADATEVAAVEIRLGQPSTDDRRRISELEAEQKGLLDRIEVMKDGEERSRLREHVSLL
jgi:hypothetical protein